jgi:hypothetical protein
MTTVNKISQNKNTKLPKELLPPQEKREFDIDKCLSEIDLGTGRKIVPLKNRVIKDYGCQSILEIMLAGRIATLYWRMTQWERWLDSLFGHGDDVYCYFHQNENVSAVREFSKGIESAHRQWISSIALLKELKRPSLNLQIKTKGAFIAQNQQINVRKRNKQTSKKKKLLMSNNLGK